MSNTNMPSARKGAGSDTGNPGHYAPVDRPEGDTGLLVAEKPATYTFPGYDNEPRTAQSALEEWYDTQEILFDTIAFERFEKENGHGPTEGELSTATAELEEGLYQFTDRSASAEHNLAALATGAAYMNLDLDKLGGPLPVADPVPVPGEEAAFVAENARNNDRPDLRAEAAASPLIKLGLLIRLAKDDEEQVARAAQANPRLIIRDIERLIESQDHYPDVILGRADTNKVDEDTVYDMAIEGYVHERLIAARNPVMHESVLDKLMQDENDVVAEAAAVTLAARN